MAPEDNQTDVQLQAPTETPAKPVKAGETVPVGHTWEISTSERVEIQRPDSDAVKVDPTIDPETGKGTVLHVLTAPGTYVCGDHSITAE